MESEDVVKPSIIAKSRCFGTKTNRLSNGLLRQRFHIGSQRRTQGKNRQLQPGL
ncbi:hypothetical protein [Neisseria iguanae]|uniref:hypothetical protein n=1 Tax=Neisseria iguanae TaxID=90242 RepID=UPI001474C378|nr:hypothetical protein [Neisseria iguanae]